MHPTMDIRSVLNRFAAQRQRLLWRKAALTLFSTLFAGALAGAFLDYCIAGADGFRLPLALAIYAAAAWTTWKKAGQALCNPPDDATLARMIEHSSPALGGRLLSTVELSAVSPESAHGRSGFFPLLQKDAQQRVRNLPADILSVQRPLRREAWFFAAAAIPALLLLLTQGGRVHMARSLVPFVDIERPSLTKIRILHPAPRERFVPEHEQVPIEVEIHNPGETAPVLEVHAAGRPSKSVAMSPAGTGRFIAALDVQSQRVHYRVHAGDASTPLLNLQPAARPKALSHAWQLRFPPYTGKPDLLQTDASPQIQALVGTAASFNFETSEPVREAGLRIAAPASPANVPLHADPKNAALLHAELPIRENLAFHLHLVSQRTGLSSLPHPLFQIQTERDAPPSIQITSPAEDTVLQSNGKLPVQFSVTDDFPGVAPSAWLRRGNAPWQETPLGKTTAPSVQVRDALPIPKAEPSAQQEDVFFKVTAVDSAGQKAESRTIRIRNDSKKKDADALDVLEQRKALGRSLENLTHRVEKAAGALAEAAGAGTDSKQEMRAQATAEGAAQLEAASRSIEEIQRQLHESIRSSESDREDARMASLALNRLQHERIAPLQSRLEKLSEAGNAASSASVSQQLKAAAVAAKEAHELSIKTDALMKSGLASQLAEALSRTPDALPPPTPAVGLQTAGNPQASKRFEENAGQLANLSRTAKAALEDSLQTAADPEAKPEQRDAARATLREQIPPLRDALASEQNDARNALRGKLRPASELAGAAARDAAQSMQSAEAKERIAQTAETLRADARTEAARPDAESSLEQTLTQAARALRGQAQSEGSPREMAQAAAQVGNDLRALEAFAQLEQTAANASRVTRNHALSADSAKDSPGGLPPALQKQIRETLPPLRDANFPEDAVAAAEASQNAKTPAEASKLLNQALEQSRDSARTHQSSLAAIAPSLSSELSALAQKARQGAQKTDELLSSPPPSEMLKSAAKEEQQLAREIEAVRDALRAEANAQNTLSAEGRERARDADAADAVLRPAPQAAQALDQASKQPEASKPLLENAATLQKQNASTLADLAEHFANLQSGSSEKAKASREKLRTKEKGAGVETALANRSQESEKLESLASQAESQKGSSPQNPLPAGDGASSEEGRQKPAAPGAPQTADSGSKASPGEGKSSKDSASKDASQLGQSSAAQAAAAAAASARDRAENAVKAGSPTAPQAVAAAVEARKQADRQNRSEQSMGAPSGDSGPPPNSPPEAVVLPALTAEAPSQNADWAKLPKRVADDLKRGRKEGIRGDYQQAVDAYFRAVAEKAQRQP